MLALAFVLGVLIIIPIGGADMPVVVSMLNSYSGWAAAGIGFSLNNAMLIIAGSLVGSSGAILCYIMCKAMNRSFFNVILGGFGGEAGHGGRRRHGAAPGQERQRRRRGLRAGQRRDRDHRAGLRPGGGARPARGEGAGGEAAPSKGVTVKYAIHPVAGRMPGHMNVLLAEAEVPYDQVFEMEDINGEFGQADVAIVLGANDVVNPAALQKGTPIYGMPILEAYKAKTVIVNKRSHGRRLRRPGQRAVLHGQDHDGLRRRQEGGRGHGQGDRVVPGGRPPAQARRARTARQTPCDMSLPIERPTRPWLSAYPAGVPADIDAVAVPLAGAADGGELHASTRDRTAYSFMGKDVSFAADRRAQPRLRRPTCRAWAWPRATASRS